MILVFCGALWSCRKDKPDSQTQPIIQFGNNGAVLISNEGNFQFANASVSRYDKQSGQVIENYYSSINNEPLGDICQSITLFNGKYYIVMNNSSRVIVVNAATFKKETEITGLTSPRYFLPISNNKAYVSDLYHNSITIVNLADNTISGSIALVAGTEQMLSVYGKVYVTSLFNDYVYIINSSNDQLLDSVHVAYASNSICQDYKGMIWILCTGDSLTHKPSALFKLNPLNNNIAYSYYFSGNNAPWRLKATVYNDTMYFINKHVYRIAARDSVINPTLFVNGNNKTFYGLGVDPVNSEVYISDAIDYMQKGLIYRYSSDGSQISQFRAGVIPGDFYFISP
jgi:hypothetical protein